MTAPTRCELVDDLLGRQVRPPARRSTPSCRGCRRCGPSPRPDSWGTAAPQAATSGHSGRLILSPTPPVECLSTVGRLTAAEVQPLAAGDHRRRSRWRARGRPAPEEDGHQQGRGLLVGDLAGRVGRQEPADLLVGERATVPLGPDDVGARPSAGQHAAGVERPRQHVAHRLRACRRRRPGSPARRAPTAAGGTARTASPAARRRTVTTATSRPPPVTCRIETSAALGAQRQAVGRVLDVAPGDDPAVVGQAGGAHVELRVRHVRVLGRRQRRVPQRVPVDVRQSTVTPCALAPRLARRPPAGAGAARRRPGRSA